MAIPFGVLRASVGRGGVNQRNDVLMVQKLLNAVPSPKGGPLPQLAVDGLCGTKTCGAIERFQSVNTGFPDGRIDAGKKTEQALLALLTALGVLARLLTPVVSGPQTPIRLRMVSVAKSLLPPPGLLTPGQKTGGQGTACGEFPGRVFQRIPVIPAGQPGAFNITVAGAGICYLTSPMTVWEKFAQTVDAQYRPQRKTWVPFTGGNRPLPGDVYLLSALNNPPKFQHVGVIIDATGSEWTTADAGQGNGFQSGIMKRHFHSSGQIDGEFGNQAQLKGWVDLDALFAVAIAAFPKNL